jgi:hypothetical protein
MSIKLTRFIKPSFIVAEVLVLAGTLVLAVLWIKHPGGAFDGLALLSTVVLAVLEVLRRLVEPERSNQKLEQSIGELKELLARKPEPSNPLAPPPIVTPPSNPLLERMQSLMALRATVIDRMNTLAQVKGISTNQQPLDIATQLPIPDTFKKALQEFLIYTTEIRRDSEPMSEWASGLGTIVQNALDMLIHNATAPVA